MKDTVDSIFALFTQYGYGAVFAGVMLDNVGVPMAGELTLLLSGSLVAEGAFGRIPTVLVAAFAALCSDGLWYGVGRLGGGRLIRIYCRLSFGTSACLARTEDMLSRFGPRSLIIARFVPGFRTFAVPMAGMSGIPLWRFMLYDGIGALLWASVGVSLGALFARRIGEFIGQMESARNGMLVLAGLLLALFVAMKLWVRWRHGRAVIEAGAESAHDAVAIRGHALESMPAVADPKPARMQALQWRVWMGETLPDIDEPADLANLPEHLGLETTFHPHGDKS